MVFAGQTQTCIQQASAKSNKHDFLVRIEIHNLEFVVVADDVLEVLLLHTHACATFLDALEEFVD